MNKLENFPTSYYVTLEESVDRQKNIVDQFQKYGISPIPIISKRFSESNDTVTGKYSYQLNAGTAGCCVSHLKAIKNWYESADDDYAFFFEDDLSLETVQYWDFTWEEFIESLPQDAECVQLLTIRNDFETFELRERYWNDWGATAYILTRDYAKKIIDTYIKEDAFHLEVPNSEVMPLIENILFTTIGKSYTVPLFVENIEFDSTFSKDQDDDVNSGQKNNHKVAHEIVLSYWKNKMKKYNVVDCFPYFNEKELLELRVNLLKNHVDLFVIIDGNYTHSGNPKEFSCRQVIEELNLPKDKIHLIELDMSDESVGPPTVDYDLRFSSNAKVGSRERFQRDAIKDILDKFDDHTVFIVSDCDEIINPNNINFLSDMVRYNSRIFKVPLVLLEGRADLRVYNKSGNVEPWDKSMFMCLKKHLEKTPATHIRNGQDVEISYASGDNQIFLDLGWHFAWMQSSEDRVYKFQSFCHANDDLKVLLNKDYTKDEHVEFMRSYFPEEGQISPSGNVDQVLKKYPTENLPDIIWNLSRVKNYLLPEIPIPKNELERLLTKYSLDTENSVNNFNLGVWYENSGHTAPALSYFLRSAERSEDDNLAYESLIRASYCYDKQGTRDGSAKSLLEQALCLMPKRPEAYFILSRFAERRAWWQDCYIYADQGLMFADYESYPPLRTDVEYPGKYGLLFEKAVSGYWWGKDKECKEIFLDLRQNYPLSEQYLKVVDENLTKMGMEIPEIKIENIVVDENFFETEYQNACNNPSDINQNLPVLYEIAKECSHITEFGVRTGSSTRAFLNTNASLRSYDLSIDSYLNSIFKKAQEFGKDVSYTEADVLNIEIEETDLLFIDTWHQYEQLKQELKIHGKKSRKYIAFHDTQTYGVTGENCSNASSGEIVTGYMENPMGLLPAIIEFMIENPEWQFKIHKTNNNGLTVLEKKKKNEAIPVIGVPIVNGFHWLQRLVDSIDYPVRELCVINNNGRGELDEDLEKLSKTPHKFIEKIKVCNLPANIGCSGAWNLIIKTHMMDPYWLIVNHDIAFSPGLLKELFEKAKDDEYGIIKGKEAQWDIFLLKDWVVENCGLFDENFYPAYVEDCDYFIRTQKKDVKIYDMNLPYLHGEKNYETTGSQTWRTDMSLKEKLDYAHTSNHYYMEEKWGSQWSGFIIDSNGVTHHHCIWNYKPHQYPYNIPTMPITYTSYDLKFVRRKNMGF